jgi:hypothetical protein
MGEVIPIEHIEKAIIVVRGHKVILDEDLARLYGISTGRLNEQVRRNLGRFPPDFLFELSVQEFRDLKSQNATSKKARGGRRHLPLAFSEHGVLMAANVLNSPSAIDASIQLVRGFIRLRQIAFTHRDLARKIEALERKYDGNFQIVFEAIRELMEPPSPKKKTRIGF